MTSLSNTAVCVPYFQFPDAYNREIEDVSASSEHMKACGSWIKAGGLQTQVEYRAMHDHSAWLSALENAENASTYSPRTAKGPMSKFRAECMRTAAAGGHAIYTAGKLAYQQLKARIEVHLSSQDGLLKAEGYLSGHLCEAGIRIGTSLYRDGSFALTVSDGYTFESGVLAAALHVMGESSQLQTDAELAASAIRNDATTSNPTTLGTAGMTKVLEGATGESSNEYFFGSPSSNTALILLPAVLRHYDTSPVRSTQTRLLSANMRALSCARTHNRNLASCLPCDRPLSF